MAKTLFDKIWDAHIVKSEKGCPDVLFIDTHFIHEVTSPQAFDGLRKRNLPVFMPHRTRATADHNVPTVNQHLPIKDAISKFQVDKLTENTKEFGIELYGLGHPFQGIVHVIGPELGITQPGMTIVCGDSHTSTHGAFGTIAFGIGTSEVEMVLATQCVLQYKPKTMRITINGKLSRGVLSKDIILYLIAQISAAGGTGYFVEFAGSTISDLSMEARMTVCNMAIEMGARGGLIAPDEKTYSYLKNKEFSPKQADWENKIEDWKKLFSDTDAKFDKEYVFEATKIQPMITYGTNPGMGVGVADRLPFEDEINPSELFSFKKSLDYMGLISGQEMIGKQIDYVFIGSCTNSRIEDLRLVADFVKGKKIAHGVEVWIVPGSKQVEKQAQEEGIDKILNEAGMYLREPGCSACLGMNEDKIPSGKYAVSTSNRNFEGRQGPGARTFLVSPLTAALAAVTGKIDDIRKYM